MKINARTSALLPAAAAGVFAFVGAWQRRWISDDGLIVLRTVRNILAGNGPVFNAGERVEANTSALWQYLVALFGWLTGARLEDVAMWLALLLSAGAAATATHAGARFWAQPAARAGAAPWVLPFGAILYFALPPARDFATSGLEWGLSIFWLAGWWALLVSWARPARHRAAPLAGYLLAFWCGLSWLVRPELALYGGVTGVLLLAQALSLASARGLRRAAGILGAALPVPLAYEIFRMGYYGLLTPHTAVAKSAADSEWGQGVAYIWDFVGTYALWLPLIAGAVLGVWLLRGEEGRRRAIVLVAVACALVHVLYVWRLGGDFMHGRMLLLPLFALLLPVMAVPARPLTVLATAGAVVWAGVVIVRAHPLPEDLEQRDAAHLGVVDEREFWTMAVGRESGDPPRYAEDFLTSRLMRNWSETLSDARRDNAGQMMIALVQKEPKKFAWFYRPRLEGTGSDLEHQPVTAYLLNLGMTGMNADLDARILDTVGLTTPLAARMPRDPDGRVGHDKYLPPEWQAADTADDIDKLPDWVDKEKTRQARAALRTPEIAALLASSRAPMSVGRFVANLRYALGPGRTLQLDDDPATYLDEDTLRRIADGEDVGRSGTPVAWPR